MKTIIRMIVIVVNLMLLTLAFNYLQRPDYFGDVEIVPLVGLGLIAGIIIVLVMAILDKVNNHVDD